MSSLTWLRNSRKKYKNWRRNNYINGKPDGETLFLVRTGCLVLKKKLNLDIVCDTCLVNDNEIHRILDCCRGEQTRKSSGLELSVNKGRNLGWSV